MSNMTLSTKSEIKIKEGVKRKGKEEQIRQEKQRKCQLVIYKIENAIVEKFAMEHNDEHVTLSTKKEAKQR